MAGGSGPDVDSLVAVVNGRPPASNLWRRGLDPDFGSFRPEAVGSVNIPAIAHAVQAYVEGEFDSAAEYWQKRWQAAAGEAPIPDRRLCALDSQELGSRTYIALTHVAEACATARFQEQGREDLVALGNRSLRERMAFLLLQRVDGVTIQGPKQVRYFGPIAVLAGMRGTHRDQNDFDPLMQRVMEVQGPSRIATDLVSEGYDVVAPRLTYAEGLKDMGPADLVRELGPCRVIAPWHVRVWDDLAVAWVDYNVNGNTGCMYFCAYGALTAEPAPGGFDSYRYTEGVPPIRAWGWPYADDQHRIRNCQQGLGGGWCKLEGEVLTCANLGQEEAEDPNACPSARVPRAIFNRSITLPATPPRFGVDLSPDADPVFTEG